MEKLPLEKLHPNPDNPNKCSPEVMAKLTENIKRTGQCPALIARPHPELTDEYMIIDGHHRLQIIQTLGWKKIECQIWDLPDEEAAIAMATLNRLHGEDQPFLRAQLLQKLSHWFTPQQLSQYLPESSSQINDYLKMLDHQAEAVKEAFQKQIEREKQSLPVPFHFMVPAEKASLVKETLEEFKPKDGQKELSGLALVALCEQVKEDANEKA